MIAKLIYSNGMFEEPEIFAEEIQEGESFDVFEICENLWTEHNKDDRKDGKIRRSMCVGDIIVLECNNVMNFNRRVFLCCKEGFIEI